VRAGDAAGDGMLHPSRDTQVGLPPIGGSVHPDYRDVAVAFTGHFRGRDPGGAALCVRHRGEVVVDVWGGYADPSTGRPWERDTMAMSFSTTKGIASTVIHRLADRGLLEYDERVATYWPAFGGQGREVITVRQLLSHQAGMYRIRGLVDDPEELLDHEHVLDRLTSHPPVEAPGSATAYHGLTYGWLVAGLAHAVTGRWMRELFQQEVARPLDLDGLHLGAPEALRDRVAPLRPETPVLLRWAGPGRLLEWFEVSRPLAEALLVDGFEQLWFEPEQRILDAQIPAVNGVFTARSLATVYAALANAGEVDGTRLLSAGTVHEAGRVQTRERDRVLNMPLRWRLGYHQVLAATTDQAWRAFGHHGYGGSGGWADPETGVSVGYVTNRLWSTTTPLADTRLIRLSADILRAARRR
jgi:CubicO group peptidase (beta-lactamase class C family)